MSTIGNRLETALLMLAKCKNNLLFADIGSDHAFLAIEAKRRGICENAVASDINEQPLKSGEENAKRFGIDIEFVLSDGFDMLDTKPLTSAAICGMGGELIAKMVLRSKAAKNCYLILQPMTAQEELRKALWDNGFEIIEENFVSESQKTYVIIAARFTGNNTNYSYCDLYLGKNPPNNDDYEKYRKKTAIAAKKRRLGIIARGGDTTDIDRLIDMCHTQTVSF